MGDWRLCSRNKTTFREWASPETYDRTDVEALLATLGAELAPEYDFWIEPVRRRRVSPWWRLMQARADTWTDRTCPF